jgi:hypothetical protein
MRGLEITGIGKREREFAELGIRKELCDAMELDREAQIER